METNEQQRKVRFSDIKSDEISKISFNTGQRKPSTTFSPALSQVNEEDRYISDSNSSNMSDRPINGREQFSIKTLVRNKTEPDLHVKSLESEE